MKMVQRLVLAAALMAGLSPVIAQSPTPVPALPDTERRTSYSITGSTCACSVGFALYGDSSDYGNWLEVWVNGVLISPSNYTITSPSNPSLALAARPITDAVLTFSSAQTGTVQIVGARRPRRVSQFNENTGVPARNLNQVITDIVAMLREVWDKINDTTGRVPRAPPGETMTTLPPAASRANAGAGFDSGGNLVPTFTPSGSTSFNAGNGITFTGTNPTTISVTSTGGGTPPCAVASRAIAVVSNLSACQVVTTGGYTNPGDGGQATFVNVGSTAFIDSFITSFTISGGTGYTTGGYFGVTWSTGTKPFAIGTASAAGGAVTAVSVAGTPGGSCNPTDVYTPSSFGSGSGATITITGCSSPLGSFSDGVGTHWQIVYDGVSPNIRQFGSVGNWAGTDASATDNFNSIQAAAWFVSYMNQLNSGNGGYWGGRLWVPQGTYKVCGSGSTSLIIPNGVRLEGASSQGSVIHMCDAFNGATNFIELCDPNWHFACFDSVLSNIQLHATRNAAATVNGAGGTFAMVHSRSTQDFGGLYHVYIYGGLRTCLWLEHGDGGASTVSVEHLSCSTDSAGAQIQIGNTSGSGLNFGTTIINLDDIVLGGSSSGGTYQSGNGILVLGGFVNINKVHCEEMPACVEVNNSGATSAGQVWINNINAGSGAPAPACTGTIQLDSTNTQGNTVMSMVPTGSCTNVITNGVSGGANFTSTITKAIACTTTCS